MTTEFLRFYGRHHGKRISAFRQDLMKTLLPQILFSGAESLPTDRPVFLEIGFGGGEHLLGIAQQHPDALFIGAEPFVNGVASLLDLLYHNPQVKNVRIFPDDVRKLFEIFPNGIFDGIFLLYPDPWPKVRHEKRRFLVPAQQKELARLLKKDGWLQVATDEAGYALWAQEIMRATGLWRQTLTDVHCPPPEWVTTRYEQKGLKAGRVPTYLLYVKS